ncbi:restriction endonuclease [Phytohalomonas tamaricis]|uniref:restriction endonuclease n=1 Tax=Phytohalomonas tamaricis TaxID=2081032 RepID=UPI000D0BADD8|nr:restriction endonuclease [Phytohalomonas tamaricis]
MPIPDYQTLLRPLLVFASSGEERRVRDAYDVLADAFELSEQERQTLVPSGQQYLLNNRATWAVSYLRKAGLLESRGRGIIAITSRGRDALATAERIDLAYLMRFEEFRDFRRQAASGRSASGADSLIQKVYAASDESLTPQETLEVAWRAMRADLESDLIDKMRQINPARFEQLVIDVLITMGYGGDRHDAGRTVGRSGDGGIDGIINEDPLGLDTIYLQAKRWEGSVGRPDVQKFAGALQGKRARKGVFITTSTFTKEAVEYVTLIDTRIVLIDGQQLARLMMDHNVGVSVASTFEIKRIDSDYFLDD